MEGKFVQSCACCGLALMMSLPSLLIAGTQSGCGKTTVTLGIMAALRQRGLSVQPFKCGPDFIDPSLHLLVTGRVSRNLDIRMCGPDWVRQCFSRHADNQSISVIEGAMGLFDGGSGSAAELAALLKVPVLLVLDVRSMAESAAAVLRGFETLDPRLRIAGVIFNQVGSARHLQLVSEAVRRQCRAEIIGWLPRESGISLPSRHLGLHMGAEVELNRQRLVSLIEEHVDLDRLLALAGEAQIPAAPPAAPLEPVGKVRLGVAWDEAFCFYYQDNLDLLQAAGAEIVRFSPLHDKALPENVDGLYFGGGYPELHAAQLAANHTLREQVLAFSRAGRPVYAECGGFMYLCEAIADSEGGRHEMAGVFPVTARMGQRLRRLGYRTAELREDCLLGPAGGVLHGHEFHYSDIDPMPDAVRRIYTLDDGRAEGYLLNRTLAGYVHLHWGGSQEAARGVVKGMGAGAIREPPLLPPQSSSL
ncbi:cobyrinate a,c-diamide synthase [Candidatus Electronema sp. JM]|uniref:cobyrinate a,c-diamide synthase n=1 Tax=Candidatus Electronema sp. JM TaxID=3401571 RepID=UPI003AA7C8F8